MTLGKLSFVALLVTGCDHLLDLRVQTEMMCVPVTSQSFTAPEVPSGPLPLVGTASKTVMVDFSKPLQQVPGEKAGLKLDVRLDQVFIRSTSDLSFVKKVKVSLAPGTPNDALPPLYIGEYVRSAMPPVNEVKIQSEASSNVVKYLQDEPARLMFTATGRLPNNAFMADVEACVFVQSQGTY